MYSLKKPFINPVKNLLVCLMLFLGSCSAINDADWDNTDFNYWGNHSEGDGVNALLARAEESLSNHNIRRAYVLYDEALRAAPSSGQAEGTAAVGKAVTRLLLLPESPQMTKLLTENLGASSGIDANDVIYGRDGLLYWLSRGARWDAQGQFEGIHGIVAGRLPWPSGRLESLANFVEGHDRSVLGLMENLVDIADEIEEIERILEVASDNMFFYRYYLPGAVFHDDLLSVTFGRSEVEFLSALLALVRGAILAAAAYDHPWTLEGAFGSWRENMTPDDSRYGEGFTPADYTAQYLDEYLLREIIQAERLLEARSAWGKTLAKAERTIAHGRAALLPTTLQWQALDDHHGFSLGNLFSALEHALRYKALIPYTSPNTSLDLSSFFEGGRTLDREIAWFEVTESEDGSSELSYTKRALQEFFTDDVFEPSLDLENDRYPELRVDGYPPLELLEPVFSSYLDRIHDVFFTTR